MLDSPDILVDGEGGQIACQDFGGEGPDLLLIHGNARTLLDWQGCIPGLVSDFRVIAMDLRSHGQSETAGWQWEAVIADVQAVCSHFEIGKPYIAGHSLGGMIAAMCAAKGIASAAINLDGYGRGFARHYKQTSEQDVLVRFSVMDDMRDAILNNPPRVPLEQLDARVAAMVQGMAAQGLEENFARALLLRDLHENAAEGYAQLGFRAADNAPLIDELDLAPIFAATQVPLLLVNCTRSDVSPPGAPDWFASFMAEFREGLALELQDLVASNELLTVKEIQLGHGLLLEAPAEVVDVIKGFLQAKR